MASVVTGVEMFHKQLDEGMAGDNCGLLLRGIERTDVERGMVVAKPKSITPHKQVHERSVRAAQGRRRAAQGILHWLSAAVLHPHDGCDRATSSCRKAWKWSCRATTSTWKSN